MKKLIILKNRLKNLWAWSAYKPVSHVPDNVDVGFEWTDWKKPVNVMKQAEIIKKVDPLTDFLEKNF